MPWTLYRYILKDILKLLVIATVVMIGVISLAASIRPLADGLLSPFQLLKFIFYIAPTMLGFTMPFATAFACTLVFTRLAQDNEILACSAGGLSHRQILGPVLGLGVALAIGMLVLSNLVVPRFFQAAAELIERDALGVLVAQLNRNLPFRQGDWVIYADDAREIPVDQQVIDAFPTDQTPRRVIELRGVAVANLLHGRKVQSDATAERATAVLFTDEQTDQSWVAMQLRNAVYFDPMRGKLANRRWSPIIEVPDRFSDNPKFLSWSDLNRLEEQPQLYDRVQDVQAKIVERLTQQSLMARVRRGLAENGEVTLVGPREGETYVIQGPTLNELEGRQLLESADNQPVLVVKQQDGEAARWFEANEAVLDYQTLRGREEPVVSIELSNVMVLDRGEDVGATEHAALQLPALIWPGGSETAPLPRTGRGWELQPLLARADAQAESGDTRLSSLLAELNEELLALSHEIAVLRHERLASAVSVLLLTLIGALLSMTLRHQMVLIVYLFSFLLAILNIILINTGPTFARAYEYPVALKAGLMWSGNILVILLCIGLYRRIAKH